jgi:hypothetical protein|tara:strand:- start:103 stop:261 length:159 start_codon:yes stop_codon:yes gene_type:complete
MASDIDHQKFQLSVLEQIKASTIDTDLDMNEELIEKWKNEEVHDVLVAVDSD